MRTFSFNSKRKKSLLDDVQLSLEVNRKLKEALVNTPLCSHLAEHIATEAFINGEDVTFRLSDYNGIELSEAGDLRERNPHLLRKVRYDFRDWRLAVLDAVLINGLISDLRIESEQLQSYLAPENTVLWMAEDPNGTYMWKCCLGFAFEKHSDNYLPIEAGPYQEKPVEIVADYETLQHVAPSEPQALNNQGGFQQEVKSESHTQQSSTSAAPAQRFWWKGKEPQAALVCSVGFLFAAILGSLYFHMNPCDTSLLEQQISNLEQQIDQRCRILESGEQ